MATKRIIDIIWSESWLSGDIDMIAGILKDTIKDFVGSERIINIECKKDSSGLSRFWIYTEEVVFPKKNKKQKDPPKPLKE